jgi:hypothetical protein
LCGGLLPAQPLMREVDRSAFSHPRLCPLCLEKVRSARRADQPGWRQSDR